MCEQTVTSSSSLPSAPETFSSLPISAVPHQDWSIFSHITMTTPERGASIAYPVQGLAESKTSVKDTGFIQRADEPVTQSISQMRRTRP